MSVLQRPTAVATILVTAAAGLAFVAFAPAAAGREPCSLAVDRCRRAEPAAVSSYAEPLTALDGRSLAQYLADRQAERLGPVGV
jgi:hypothetical protein